MMDLVNGFPPFGLDFPPEGGWGGFPSSFPYAHSDTAPVNSSASELNSDGNVRRDGVGNFIQ